jgi:hypothetical protein
MGGTRLLRLAHITGVTIGVLLLMQGLASAQDVTEPALKAALIYNFAKFTEWPIDLLPARAPLAICVLGDTAVADALDGAVKGRVLAGHPISVSHVAAAGPLRSCQVLYVSGALAAKAGPLLGPLRDAPVLTISDIDGFNESGGIAQFYFEHGQFRFSVHLEAARRARLQISSRLLVLAKRQ